MPFEDITIFDMICQFKVSLTVDNECDFLMSPASLSLDKLNSLRTAHIQMDSIPDRASVRRSESVFLCIRKVYLALLVRVECLTEINWVENCVQFLQNCIAEGK